MDWEFEKYRILVIANVALALLGCFSPFAIMFLLLIRPDDETMRWNVGWLLIWLGILVAWRSFGKDIDREIDRTVESINARAE